MRALLTPSRAIAFAVVLVALVLLFTAWPLVPFIWEKLPEATTHALRRVPVWRWLVLVVAVPTLAAAAVWRFRAVRRPIGLAWLIGGAWAAAVLVVALIVAALWLLLGLPGLETTATVPPQALDAAATRAFAVVAGLGGVALLVIAYRRQRLNEHGEQREETKLFTERFTTAVSQLGDEQPAVRLGGVHALAHLADDAPSPGLRQMCVDVLCAYLRNPGPDDLPQGTTPEQEQAHHERVVEHAAMREVRLTIMRTITDRLHNPTPWRDCDYDFTGVTFERAVQFHGVVCHGKANFEGATFAGGVNFDGATFTGKTQFAGTVFTGIVLFVQATFTCDASFEGATFAGGVNFDGATFTGYARFAGTVFTSNVIFGRTTFDQGATFWATTFPGEVIFSGTTFARRAHFQEVTFAGDATFSGTTFTAPSLFGRVAFNGRADFREAKGELPNGLIRAAEASPGQVLLPDRWTQADVPHDDS